MQAVEARGVLFVASAGNDQADTDNILHLPSNLNSSVVLSVAASDSQDNLWFRSNYGKNTVHVAAPGVAVYNLDLWSKRGYTTMTGTSMATPHVTGTAALMLQK